MSANMSAKTSASRGRILMLAPEPVLQPRGTPMSVYHRLRALSALGYTIDLITYPLGAPIEIPGVRVIRVWKPWGLARIKIGPSAPKLLLDAFMIFVAFGCLLRRRYAAIHSHEEAVFIAAILSRLFRLPHLYDMHSSLAQQLDNWRQWYAPLVRGLAHRMEAWAIGQSDALITICPALTEYVQKVAPQKPQITIENAATIDGASDAAHIQSLRAKHHLDGCQTVVYTGNFEPYQGLELLLESFVPVFKVRPQARLVIVGGRDAEIAQKRAWAKVSGVAEGIVFVGTVAPEAVQGYLLLADVLASPRITGTNTPLKLYAYLKAGKPIVATDLYTHTQVLTPEVSRLAQPVPEAFGQALLDVLSDASLARRLGQAGRELADRKFSETTYRERVAKVYELLWSAA